MLFLCSMLITMGNEDFKTKNNEFLFMILSFYIRGKFTVLTRYKTFVIQMVELDCFP